MVSNQPSIKVEWGTELSLAATSFDGMYNNIGSALTHNPVVMIFDNQTDVEVPLSTDGVNTWKTFVAGQSLVLDVRTNHGSQTQYSPEIGTQFETNASVGTTGSFRITYIY